MNALAPITASSLVPTNMDEAIRLAKVMASSKMLPQHLHDDVGTCLMIVEQAMRWQMSPFAVAQCSANIRGKMVYEGKIVAAAVQTCGAIEGNFDYEFKGEGDDRTVTVSARRRGETNPRQMTIRLRDVRTSNEIWTKQPDQQLVYSGNRNWARRFTPAALLGVYAPEEFDRTGKPTAVDDFAGQTLDHMDEPEPDARDALNDAIPMLNDAIPMTKQVPLNRAAAAGMPRAPKVTEKPEAPERTEEQWRVWVDKLRAACFVLYSRQEVVEIGERASVGEALAKGPPWVQREISAILAENFKRFPEEPEPEVEELSDDLEIIGADKLAG